MALWRASNAWDLRFNVGGFLGRFVGCQCVLSWVVERVCYPSSTESSLPRGIARYGGASVSV